MINTMQVIETALIENPDLGFRDLVEVIRSKTPIQADEKEIERLMVKMGEILPTLRANTIAYFEKHRVLGEKLRAERAAAAAKVTEGAQK